jgi:hypothetical protein
MDLALGLIAILVGIVLATAPRDRVGEWRERRKAKKGDKGPPRWRRALDHGSPRVAFIVGVALTLPGASYLIALDILHKRDLPATTTTICVIAFFRPQSRSQSQFSVRKPGFESP